MGTTATRTYKGQGVQPAIYPEDARTDAVRLAPGTYTAGTVVGQVSTLTGANDVQTLTVTGTPTGGSLTVGFGASTAVIAYNDTAANVQTTLRAVPEIGSDGVTVSGGPLPGTPIVVTFGGRAGNLPQPVFTIVANNLAGGTTPAGAWVHTTTGRMVGGGWKAYNDANSDGSEVAKGVLQYDTVVDNWGQHLSGGGEWGSHDLSASIYISGYFRTADLTGLDANGIADLGRIVEGSASTLTNVGTILRIR